LSLYLVRFSNLNFFRLMFCKITPFFKITQLLTGWACWKIISLLEYFFFVKYLINYKSLASSFMRQKIRFK
jgi:hypothetical protein